MKKFEVTRNKPTEHKEGDVWMEGDKTWTIKNGIKRTYTKMDDARKKVFMPLSCPDCGNAMKSHWDKKFWIINQTCFDCHIWQEHEIRTMGKWNEYEKAKVSANAKAFLKDVKDGLKDYSEQSMENQHVTENGGIEKWQGPDQKIIEQYIDKEIKQLELIVNNYTAKDCKKDS